MADVEVARSSDFGVNDTTFFVKTHLGNILQAGDTALGYDLTNLQIVDPEMEKYSGKHQGVVPDVFLVKKSYAESRRRRRERGVARNWRLQRMQVEEDEETQQRSRGSADRMAQDEELFYQELEEDEETRAQVQIFKDENAVNANVTAAAGDDDDDDDDAPEVPIEELLDELTLLQRQADDEDDENDLDDLDDSMQE